jgi:hypothetical protein
MTARASAWANATPFLLAGTIKLVCDQLGIHSPRQRSKARKCVRPNPHRALIKNARHLAAIILTKIELAYDIRIPLEDNSYAKIKLFDIITAALDNSITEYGGDCLLSGFVVNSVYASYDRQRSHIYCPAKRHLPRWRNDHQCYFGRRIEGHDLRFKILLHLRLHSLGSIHQNKKQEQYEGCADHDA